MRRRIRFILPIFLIAVWAQVFAPFGARLFMAAITGDSFTQSYCTSEGKAESRDQAPLSHHDGEDCCGLCQAAHGPPPVLHPALIGVVSPPALYRLITRYVPEARPHAVFFGEQTRARASPQAA